MQSYLHTNAKICRIERVHLDVCSFLAQADVVCETVLVQRSETETKHNWCFLSRNAVLHFEVMMSVWLVLCKKQCRLCTWAHLPAHQARHKEVLEWHFVVAIRCNDHLQASQTLFLVRLGGTSCTRHKYDPKFCNEPAETFQKLPLVGQISPYESGCSLL